MTHRAALKKHVTEESYVRVGIDIAGPYNMTSEGNRYILVISDYFTKWVEAYPLKDQEALPWLRYLFQDLCVEKRYL